LSRHRGVMVAADFFTVEAVDSAGADVVAGVLPRPVEPEGLEHRRGEGCEWTMDEPGGRDLLTLWMPAREISRSGRDQVPDAWRHDSTRKRCEKAQVGPQPLL
jgi:hypothetical protein